LQASEPSEESWQSSLQYPLSLSSAQHLQLLFSHLIRFFTMAGAPHPSLTNICDERQIVITIFENRWGKLV
jgi:hypothetical protein